MKATKHQCGQLKSNVMNEWTDERTKCDPITRVGPTGAGPQQKSSGPGKNNWTDHVPSGLPDKNYGIFGHFWYLKNRKRPCVSLFHDSFPMTHGHFRSISVILFEMHCMST